MGNKKWRILQLGADFMKLVTAVIYIKAATKKMGCYNFGSILLNIVADIYFNAPIPKKLGADFVKPVTAVICVEATTKKNWGC
jgi:hypothetical protein